MTNTKKGDWEIELKRNAENWLNEDTLIPFVKDLIAQALAEERERMREKIENAIKYTNWSHSVGSHSDDRGGDSDVECTCKEDEARYQTVAYKNTLSFLSSPDSNPKCVCGEQDILGGAEVEIGGVCHRPKNPCYIIEPLTDKNI